MTVGLARPGDPPFPVPLEPGSSGAASAPPLESLQSFLDSLLAEQQRIDTPATRYSRFHDNEKGAPALAAVYRDLIPLSAPGPGEQYAFEVDLDACSGCKACVAGCHSLNGLEETETWRDVGLVIGGGEQAPFQQTITSACHHCADPACLNGCPVLAYEKDPATGIVRHLDDQCIGCSYCILKCPYDVPKFSSRLGIVRKCDMCHGRLGSGEAPACVQACPTHAIRIVTLEVHASPSGRPTVDTTAFLPGAPDPARTLPTTRYVSRRVLPGDLRPADGGQPRVQPGHTPLALMLVLTQVALGLQAGAMTLLPFPEALATAAIWRAAWIFTALGLLVSVLHLGRPGRAWRIFLGLRRSWLSREAVVFGAWIAVATLGLAAPTVAVRVATVGLGALGVFCSAMVYIDTGRRAWRPVSTCTRFVGTGLLAALIVVSPLAAGATLTLKLVLEAMMVRAGPADSRRLLLGPLQREWRARHLLGGLAAGLLILSPILDAGVWVVAASITLIAEVLERSLFFRAVDASRMPGLPQS